MSSWGELFLHYCNPTNPTAQDKTAGIGLCSHSVMLILNTEGGGDMHMGAFCVCVYECSISKKIEAVYNKIIDIISHILNTKWKTEAE